MSARRAYNRFGVPILVKEQTMPDPLDNPDIIAAAETHCLSESSDGYLCTGEPNHDGWHRAVWDGELLDTWPQPDLT